MQWGPNDSFISITAIILSNCGDVFQCLLQLESFSFGSILMLGSDLAASGCFLLKLPHLLGLWTVIFSHFPPVSLPHQCQSFPSHLTTLLMSLGWNLKWVGSVLRPPRPPLPPLPPLPGTPWPQPTPPFWW